MAVVQQVLFLTTLAVAIFLIGKRVSRIKSNIQLGKPTPLTGSQSARWRNVLLIAFGQKKMFKRIIPAFLHFWIYIGFIIINLEVLEFILDGLLGTHRLFAPWLGGLYHLLMNFFEFLAIAVLAACVVFLFRRNILKVKRFWSAEMTAWPRLDGNLILVIEIALMLAILTMNASDQVLQARDVHYVHTGRLFFSALLMPLFEGLGTPTLIAVERAAWWFHIVGILGFALGSYVQGPYSPHELAQHGMVRTFQLTKSLTKLPVIQSMALGAKGQVGERLSRGLIHPLWTDQEASIEERADELLKRFKLDHMRNEFAGTLSGGQRKLLEMARALMTDPTLVMLDEPMAGVNPALTQSLLEHIQGLRDDGLTVVFVEHDMDVVSEISDWVVVMAEGRIIAEGPPAAIGRNQQVIDAYLGSDHESNLVRTVDGTGTRDAPTREAPTGDVTTSDVTDDATGKGSDGASNSDGGV